MDEFFKRSRKYAELSKLTYAVGSAAQNIYTLQKKLNDNGYTEESKRKFQRDIIEQEEWILKTLLELEFMEFHDVPEKEDDTEPEF
jgi:hypothetical protein